MPINLWIYIFFYGIIHLVRIQKSEMKMNIFLKKPESVVVPLQNCLGSEKVKLVKT